MIARLHEDGQSIRQIAAALDRQPSDADRPRLKCNSGAKVGYQPAYAQAQTAARRWTGARLVERDDALREEVRRVGCRGLVARTDAGRLAHEQGHRVISHETIYRLRLCPAQGTNDRRWRALLTARAKYKRGWRTGRLAAL